MKKLLALAILIAGTMVMVSCGDDDESAPTFDQPNVVAGSASDLANAGTGTVDFTITLDADLTEEASWVLTSSANVTATIGGATSGTIGASATVTADITASTTAGPATVTLEVTNPSQDPAELSDDATVVFSVLPVGDEPVEISGIPTTATISEGGDLGPVPYTVDGADGLATFTLSVNDAAAIDFAAVTGDDLSSNPASITGTFTVDYATLVSLGVAIGTNELEFTATDVDGSSASFTHVLTVTEFPTVDVFAAEDGVGEGAAAVTWTADNIYILRGFVFVNDGQTLTIEPGTVIKGQTGQGAGASALIVARGGTLIADGTADLPIIFTALADEITPVDLAAGEYVSPNLPATLQGQWGGLIMLGEASISESSGGNQLTEQQIEGIPASEERGLYGGSTDDDNSGVLDYVSVRHAGTNIGAGNEINGITFGGVGSGTMVSNVEVVANADDGIEWFGGDVDVTNAIIWNVGDDGLDSDQDWIGTADGFLIVTPSGSAFELDGPEGTLNRGVHTFINGTVYAGDDIDHLVDWDGSTNAELQNMYFFGWSETYGFIQDEDPDEAGDQNFNPIESYGGDGAGTNSAWEYTLASGGGAADEAEIFNGVTDDILTAVAANANTVGGPAASVFAWTFAGASGALAGLGL